jgi:hypothetical protein
VTAWAGCVTVTHPAPPGQAQGMEYHVSFEIEVDANDPVAAARKVAQMLDDGVALRAVYHVNPHHVPGVPPVRVDLEEIGDIDPMALDIR